MSSPWSFLGEPGARGAMGALMDEYARAANDLCLVVEAIPPARFERTVESADPSTTSVREICRHVAGAARRYADYIRKARGLEHVDRFELEPARLVAPADLRPRLGEALCYTEGALAGLHDAPEDVIAAIKFEVRWGPTYDPEMLLEHAIVHLLRHRRQIGRWPV
jgi:uncharacterized damage-inducible protein DinB